MLGTPVFLSSLMNAITPILKNFWCKCRTPLKKQVVYGSCADWECAPGICACRCHSLCYYIKYRIDKLMLTCEVEPTNIYTGDRNRI